MREPLWITFSYLVTKGIGYSFYNNTRQTEGSQKL